MGHDHETPFAGNDPSYRRVLVIVIAINAAMAIIEGVGGWLAHSTAMLADALDFLEDTATYAIGYWAIGRSGGTRARVAMVNGLISLAAGLGVLAAALYRWQHDILPDPASMGAIGALALAANLYCAFRLMAFRQGDASVRAVWLSSRNDALGNLAVIAAGILVAATGSLWPDLAVALALAALFIGTSVAILRQAWRELKA